MWSKHFPHDRVEARRERKREKEERRKREIEDMLQSRYEDRISRLEAQVSAARCTIDASPGGCQSSRTSGTIPDTPINYLVGVAPCKLQVFIETLHFNMEVGRGVVHPPNIATSLHGVPLPVGYAKVQVDEVHPTFANTPLPNVSANAELQFLGQSLNSFIMWPKKDIVLDLPTSTPSPTIQRTPVHQPADGNVRRTPPLPSPVRSTPLPIPVRTPECAEFSQLEIQQSKGTKRTASRQTKESSPEVEYTSDMQFEMAPLARKYKFGAALVDDPSMYGVECQILHAAYMQTAERDREAIGFAFTTAGLFQHDIQTEVFINWEDVFDLFNDKALDVGIMRTFTL
jgi:hypothetical protein